MKEVKTRSAKMGTDGSTLSSAIRDPITANPDAFAFSRRTRPISCSRHGAFTR